MVCVVFIKERTIAKLDVLSTLKKESLEKFPRMHTGKSSFVFVVVLQIEFNGMREFSEVHSIQLLISS